MLVELSFAVVAVVVVLVVGVFWPATQLPDDLISVPVSLISQWLLLAFNETISW